MKTKTESTNINTNTNVNNNTNNIHVHLKQPRKSPSKKEVKPNWLKRTIIGGLITTLLSVGGYYLKKSLNDKSKENTSTIDPNGKPIEATKQN